MSTYFVKTTGSDALNGLSEANAWLTLGKAASTVAAGDKVNVKAGSYGETLTLSVSGTVGADIVWEAYTTTPGDATGFAVVEGGNTRATCLNLQDKVRNIFRGFTFQGATSQMLGWTGLSVVVLERCRVLKGSASSPKSTGAISGFSRAYFGFIGCEIAGCTGIGIGQDSINLMYLLYCEVHGHTGDGVSPTAFSYMNDIRGNLIYGNGGVGLKIPDSGGAPDILLHIAKNTIVGNTSHGIQIGGADDGHLLIEDNLITGNGGYGANFAAAQSGNSQVFLSKNFFYGNTSGEINNTSRYTQLIPNITLTADPITNAGAGDYSPNNTAGGGAVVRAGAPYQAFPGGTTTGYRDGGATQHQDSGGGGGGTTMFIPVE